MSTLKLLKPLTLTALCACGFWLASGSPAAPASLADLKQAFQTPPADARMMVRWWWFGAAVTKPELEKEILAMKAGGFGGFEVQPVYPLVLDGDHGLVNLPYMSDGFLDALKFAAATARAQGMRFDLTLCSGWPYGGPHIPIGQASGRLRVDRVDVKPGADSVDLPKLAEGDSIFAAALVHGNARQFSSDNIHMFPGISGNTLRLPSGNEPDRIVLFFVASHTRQQVKRPAVGSEGLVLDHYDRVALDTHLKTVGERLMAAVGKDVPYAVFSDSLEVYNSDWTPDFLNEFRKHRGYDLTPYLPALAGSIGEKTNAIRHDWGKTLTELSEENYLTPLTDWAHKHGTLFRSQTYGIPPVRLSSNALVDLPEGEGAQWKRFSATRWASSASHLYNRPVTSSETFTWLHSPVFRATPLDMKAEADIHFLNGINQFICHGWPYSPPEAGEPGWRFYAAAVFNNHNPWWLVMPDVALYMQRVSYLLRQGKPANDVAIYLPTDDAWAGFTLGRNPSINQAIDGLIGPNVIPQVLEAGYNFDFTDDGAIAKLGVTHKILILPNIERMPLATLRTIDEWARKGGIVIATRRVPSLAPGLAEAESDTPKIRELAGKLKLVADETKLGDALHAALPADVATAPEIGVVHRRLDFADVYFLANTSNHPVETQPKFRMQGMEAALWDPMTGKVGPTIGGSQFSLAFAPYESHIVVFTKGGPRPSSGITRQGPGPVDVSTGWTLTFNGSPAIQLDKLESWTDLEGRKFYSGQAAYERTVNVPQAVVDRGHDVVLTLGEGTPVTGGPRAANGMRAMLESPVHEAAIVWVNGKRAGAVWSAPYEVDITGLLHTGDNQIRIQVANLALNEMAKGPLPDYKELNAKYGERFQAQDMNQVQPLASGLLGPIKIVTR
jgi:hypothetical protein